MTEEEKKAIESIKRKITIGKCEKNIGIPVYISELEILLNLIQKQDTEINKLNNVIDRMAKKLSQVPIFTVKSKSNNYNANDLYTAPMSIEEIKEYFMKEE